MKLSRGAQKVSAEINRADQGLSAVFPCDLYILRLGLAFCKMLFEVVNWVCLNRPKQTQLIGQDCNCKIVTSHSEISQCMSLFRSVLLCFFSRRQIKTAPYY